MREAFNCENANSHFSYLDNIDSVLQENEKLQPVYEITGNKFISETETQVGSTALRQSLRTELLPTKGFAGRTFLNPLG